MWGHSDMQVPLCYVPRVGRHWQARLCGCDCPVGIRLLSPSQPHTHQSNLCSSEDVSLRQIGPDGSGCEGLTEPGLGSRASPLGAQQSRGQVGGVTPAWGLLAGGGADC